MTRKVLLAVMVVGLMLIAAPFAFGMPSKASAGQKMMDSFRPLMQASSVKQTAAYYNDDFVPLGAVVPALTAESMAKFQHYMQGFSAMGIDANKLVPAMAQAMKMTPAQAQAFMATQFPAMSAMLQNMPAMQKDFDGMINLMSQNVAVFQQVPGGLAHYKPLVTTMQAQVGNYKSADSLPSMNLFTWFFVVPGALLMGLAGFGLFSGRKSTVALATETAAPSNSSAHAA